MTDDSNRRPWVWPDWAPSQALMDAMPPFALLRDKAETEEARRRLDERDAERARVKKPVPGSWRYFVRTGTVSGRVTVVRTLGAGLHTQRLQPSGWVDAPEANFVSFPGRLEWDEMSRADAIASYEEGNGTTVSAA